MRPRARLLLVAIVLLTLGGIAAFALSLAAPPNLSAFRAGPGDLGTFRESALASGYEADAVVSSPLAVRDAVRPDRTLLVVAGVERPLRASEIAAVDSFVRAGGRLLLADDSGNANQLSAQFGVYFSDIPVLDQVNAGNASLVRLNVTFGGETFTPVVMNVPSSLTVPRDEKNGTIIATTTGDSFGDLDRDGVRDGTDLKGPFVVGYDLRVGKGRVVFLADPDFLGNSFLDNRQLANGKLVDEMLLSILGDGGLVVFEESRHGAPPVEGAVARVLTFAVTATRDPIVGWVTLGAALLGAVLLVALSPAEEALHHHATGLDRPTAVTLDAPLVRLVRAAKARIRSAHAARPEDDPARLSTDPVLAALVGSETHITPDKDLRDVARRVRSYGGSKSTGRSL